MQRGICRSTAPTAIVTCFFAAVTLFLKQVQDSAVVIYGLWGQRKGTVGRMVVVKNE